MGERSGGGGREREKCCVIQSAQNNGGRTRGKNSGTESTTLSNIPSEKGPTKSKEQQIIMTNKKADSLPKKNTANKNPTVAK